MGEARQRRSTDPAFGRIPKSGKGIVISNPLEFLPDGGIYLKSTELDPYELRRALLFWDRIEWPKNRIFMIEGSYAECEYLQSRKILSRPEMKIGSQYDTLMFRQSFIDVFLENEEREPGQWSLSEGPESLIFSQPEFNTDHGAKVTLYRAIPLPEANTPLEDLLEFKSKNKDAIKNLILVLDSFYAEFQLAENKGETLTRLTKEVDQRCFEIIRLGRESRISFKLSTLKVNFNGTVDMKKAIMGAVAGGLLMSISLAAVGAIIGGASELKLEVSGGFELGRKDVATLKASPFRFVSSLHNEHI